ncbi:trimeric intracellular cation channel family protein [Rhodanobacter sp. Si-c]|uniref:Trimeric intracellular cation channel family protein n=1 Tax=Rhodanobacter lycopersici TaxID=3162487 RepID=A0ABV3QAA4_9GAMM
MSEAFLFSLLDLTGTFVFALSGAIAARQRNLDLFGIAAVAFIVACGGGIVRDLCIGAIPPTGLSDWRYMGVSILAVLTALGAYPLVQRLAYPVRFFDGIGMGFFAVAGAHKALHYGHGAEPAILLGVVTAVGGGVMRDVLLNRIPLILQREIYASAALLGASVEVLGERLGWSVQWLPWAGILLSSGIRQLSLRYHWQLPTFAGRRRGQGPSG